jgi:hypothetical protein
MAFQIKKRGKLTYYYEGENPVFSNLVVEEQPDGDLKLYFAGQAGPSAAKALGLTEVVYMDPEIEIPLVFASWEKWLRDAGVCDSIRDVDFIEMHAFGCQPKAPNPLVDPGGYAGEVQRLRQAYSKAYSTYFKEHCPENGLPARFTVHVLDVPDKAASYEFYSTGLYQKSLKKGETK